MSPEKRPPPAPRCCDRARRPPPMRPWWLACVPPGAVLFGRTNMVEFAFSGVGINPHCRHPRNRWQREDAGGHVPGGSSSGAGVSVADGMCAAARSAPTPAAACASPPPSMVWSVSNPPRSGCQ